jgi:flavin reductase (DIM6/NTAB) family NADH-FMN oxidoreductase RutF
MVFNFTPSAGGSLTDPRDAPPVPEADPVERNFNGREFRDALAQFATGVTVVTTCAPGGGYVGLTVNSFSSVSLVPPLILWSLDRRAGSLAVFRDAARFAVNVLAHDQRALARRFASPAGNRFAGVPLRLGAHDMPLLEGCVAWFECTLHAQHEAGDHVIFIGEVVHCAHGSGMPLLFHAGRYVDVDVEG